MKPTLYPKGPEQNLQNLTVLPPSYKFRAFLAIVAIFLFFILYFALVTALGYLVYYAVIYEMNTINKLTILLKLSAIAGAAMLFVFTLKFIFKLKNHKPENRIKLKKEEQTVLWNFIDQICKDTGAPKPKHIYIDPDVNAYVRYTNVWLSLFLPIKKELTIGLGLVSTLNLSEFKAVISHEFGHFAQKSMKIGSYINSANVIIHDMIYSRDKWDRALEQWRASDIRLSAAAWVITPIIWVIRQTLALFYQFLNIMYSSLSREMEFNADKVAVSTSGSEAIISALWKLDVGFDNWNTTIHHAYLASKKKVFTKNLYIHNALAHERSAEVVQNRWEELPKDKRGGKQYFTTSESSKVSMYASHPPNDLREQSAKSPFVACEEDSRSSWLLFEAEVVLQENATALIYKQYIGKEPEEFSKTEVFENFIVQETQGEELLEEYQHTFLNRFLHIEEEENLRHKAIIVGANDFQVFLGDLKERLTTLMEPVKNIEGLMQKAVEISEGTTTEASFQFNGIEYKKKNLQEGYAKLHEEREKIFNESFKDWDIDFCAIHLAKAKTLGKDEELLRIYNQHQVIITIYKAIIAIKNTILQELQVLQEKDGVEEHEVITFGTRVKDLVASLNEYLHKIDTLEFVPMSNIDTAEECKEVIVEGGAFQRAVGNIFEDGKFDDIIHTLDLAINNCQRLDQKSIGLILMYHHNLHQESNVVVNE